jgi:hypothetical protein
VVVAVVLVTALTTRPDREGARVTTDEPPSPTTTTALASVYRYATAVAQFRGRWYAAGAVFDARADHTSASPVVWRSDDGTNWKRVWDHGDVALGSGTAQELHVVGDRLVLFTSGTGGVEAWHTTDGVDWGEGELPGEGFFLGGVTFRDRLYALTQPKRPDSRVEAHSTIADGNWQPDRLDIPGIPWLQRITAGDDLVVGGHVSTAEGQPPVVWRSTGDGHWIGPMVLGDEPADVYSLAASGSTTLAVIGRVGSTPQLWLSGERGAWEHVGDAPVTYNGNQATLVGIDDGFLAAGVDGSVLRSADGRVWAPVGTLDGRANPSPLAVDGDTVVALVTTTAGWESRVLHLPR